MFAPLTIFDSNTQVNLAYAFNPNLVLTSFVQYDNESQNVGNNMRLRWTIEPGNDLFIEWNRGWKREILYRDDLSIVPDGPWGNS